MQRLLLFTGVTATNEPTYFDCPLWQTYQKARKAYFREINRDLQLENERHRLWLLIQYAMAEAEEPKKHYWSERLYSAFCRRFQRMTKVGWVEMIASLANGEAIGKYQEPKMQRYLLLVRNCAKNTYSFMDDKSGYF